MINVIEHDTRLWINLPDSCYGFVKIYKGETTQKVGYVEEGRSTFISVYTERADKVMKDLHDRNESILFTYLNQGWVNDQFIKNRITIEFKITKRPLCLN